MKVNEKMLNLLKYLMNLIPVLLWEFCVEKFGDWGVMTQVFSSADNTVSENAAMMLKYILGNLSPGCSFLLMRTQKFLYRKWYEMDKIKKE